MKLSAQTLDILKNFSSINPGILLEPGNVLRTMSPAGSIIAKASIEEDFDQEAPIYDLTRFLSSISLFEDPDIAFKDKYFIISSGASKIKYFYATKEMIIIPPKKEIPISDWDHTIEIKWTEFQKALQASGVLQAKELFFKIENGNYVLGVGDHKNPTTDVYMLNLGEAPADTELNMIFKAENLKLLPGDYTCRLSKQGVAKFEKSGVECWVTSEAKTD